MPDSLPTAQQLSDQYDHDSRDEPEIDAPAQRAAPTGAAPEPPADRPRNADGTFAKPAYLVEAAAAAGIPEQHIGEMSAADLRDLVQHRQWMQLAKDVRESLKGGSPTAPKEPPARESAEDFELRIKGQSEDPESGYDDTLVGELRRMAAEIKAARNEIKGMQQREQTRDTREVLNRLDTLFTGDAATFGGGATDALDGESPEAVRRQAVILHLQSIPPARRTTLEKDFRRIKAALFGDAKPAPDSQPSNGHNRLTAGQQRWLDGGLERPSARTAPPEPKGPGRAAKAMKPLLEQMGIEDDPEMPE